MDKKYLLGVEVGTTSIKVVVIDENAKPLGISSSSYRLITPGSELRSDRHGRYVECIFKMCPSSSGRKETGSVQGGWHQYFQSLPGAGSHGEKGEVLVDAIIYSDRRSTEEAEMILDAVGKDRLFELTANTAMAGAMSGIHHALVKRHIPEQYEKTKYFGHLYTFRHIGCAVILLLTILMLLIRISSRLPEDSGGRKSFCEKIGIDIEKLPPLHKSTDVVGGLINEELIALGIPQGTPIVIGGGDTACATLAAGVTKAGDICESVGTTNVLTICVDQPKFDRGFINRCHVVDGTWLYQGALSTTGAAYQWFRDNFCQDLIEKASGSSKNAFAYMNEEADEAEPWDAVDWYSFPIC